MSEPTTHQSPGARAWRRFRANRAAYLSLWVLLLLVGGILLLPLFSSQSPTHLSDALSQGPTHTHWFGTDTLGRDLFSRVVHGSRISLLVGLVGAAVSLVIGVLWGATAGYLGGRWDNLMMRVVDILYSLPSIVFVIVLITTLEGLAKDFLTKTISPDAAGLVRMLFLFVGLGAVSWLTMARIVRGEVLALRSRSFVEASRLLGAGHVRILFHHILPNIAGVVVIYLMLTIPAVILYESFLSYLGLGIQPPQASLGSLIAEGAAQINPIRIYWWMVVFPASLLVVLLLALNFLGDGLRDALDPRGSREG